MCSAANCQAMLWLLSRILLCIDTSKCMVTIALVSVSGRNVLLVHGGGPFGIMRWRKEECLYAARLGDLG